MWADIIKKELHPDEVCTFVVDRNINYTNVCINKCTFCAFWRDEDSADAYLLDTDTIFRKIEETLELGGTQILIQGGLHPALDIFYYTDLLSSIKERFDINVHGFSPPEICYIADASDLTIRETLGILKSAGLDSIPGGGAEILSDRVREVLSPKKIKSSRWLEVMEAAHRLGMRTTATMMFGSIETPEDIITHLDAITAASGQDRRIHRLHSLVVPAGEYGIRSKFKVQSSEYQQKRAIMSGKNSQLSTLNSHRQAATAVEYLQGAGAFKDIP